MPELIKSVRYGILIGLFGLSIGMSWAIWLVVGHEIIHKSFEKSMVQGKMETGQSHEETAAAVEEESHQHEHTPEVSQSHAEGLHNDPIIELAHTRLRWAHVHYMGLGLLTIGLSLVLALSRASTGVKTIIPILTGLGGLIYPFAWIVMGFRTPSMGAEASETSAMAIAAPGIALVFIGILTTASVLLKDIFFKRR